MSTNRLVLVLLFTVFLLSPAMLEWWTDPDIPWYQPYILWAGMIAIAWFLQRQEDLP